MNLVKLEFITLIKFESGSASLNLSTKGEGEY
ncbi:MAG: hypothetical protein ACD_57C00035G0009 [uncultured bacterium]|nr:MAG: hypothetical protein ACD_57C00035G0009 [uncultured bacterium]